MKPYQFNRVLLHVRFELDRFETTLSRLEAHQFPSDVAKTLIGVQRMESKAADSSLLNIEEDFGDDPSGASKRLASEYRKLMGRRRHLEVLEKARSDEVPWSLVPSVERLAHQILPHRPVLVTTTPEMNYMVSWTRSAAQPVVTIYLPKLHRANAFLHVLIGHELFHPAIESFFPTEKEIITPKLRDECKMLLAHLENEPPNLFTQKRLDAVLSVALEAWERALTELMCDMGSAALFGPAALWTISGFASSQDLDSAPSPETQFYPPWRMRVHSVLEYMSKIEGDQRINDICTALNQADLSKHADAITQSLDDEKQIFSTEEIAKHPLHDPLMSKVYKHVEESLERAMQFIQNATSTISDRWVETYEQVPQLLKRLALLVPPSELIQTGKQESAAADISAIVLACWVERLVKEQDGTLGLAEYRRLCRLMLKAIEDAELKRQFVEWRGT